MKNNDLHLVAYYTLKPRDPAMTKIRGYMSNPENIYYDEMINITRGLKDRDRSSAGIVLNLSKKTIVKNIKLPDKKWDELFIYFQEGYSEYINTVMAEIDKE